VGRAPNPHIAFGGGTHFCLGTHLARLEAQLAIGGLVARFPKLELASGEVQWGASLFRVPGRLDVTL
jgi:cytochrome P450